MIKILNSPKGSKKVLVDVDGSDKPASEKQLKELGKCECYAFIMVGYKQPYCKNTLSSHTTSSPHVWLSTMYFSESFGPVWLGITRDVNC